MTNKRKIIIDRLFRSFRYFRLFCDPLFILGEFRVVSESGFFAEKGEEVVR
jgi:hypothetical protein